MTFKPTFFIYDFDAATLSTFIIFRKLSCSGIIPVAIAKTTKIASTSRIILTTIYIGFMLSFCTAG